uniref:Thioredoxin domain-containing protein 17 n=1 Tax=Glossina brevipalpis TaxID=37001 RepID=A0A1A9X4K3_9MUSC
MVRIEFAKGYNGFRETANKLTEDENVKLFVYFVGEKDDKGQSWCPDCNAAEGTVTKAVQEYADENTILLTVDVGDRPFWKDKENPFRKDSDVKLMVIPTIVRWKSTLRLDGDQCKKVELLEMLFKEDM